MYSYSTHWVLEYVARTNENNVKPPKAPKCLGSRHRYHNTSVPLLDFRLCSDAQFDMSPTG